MLLYTCSLESSLPFNLTFATVTGASGECVEVTDDLDYCADLFGYEVSDTINVSFWDDAARSSFLNIYNSLGVAYTMDVVAHPFFVSWIAGLHIAMISAFGKINRFVPMRNQLFCINSINIFRANF